jgi:hypothetical protein
MNVKRILVNFIIGIVFVLFLLSGNIYHAYINSGAISGLNFNVSTPEEKQALVTKLIDLTNHDKLLWEENRSSVYGASWTAETGLSQFSELKVHRFDKTSLDYGIITISKDCPALLTAISAQLQRQGTGKK